MLKAKISPSMMCMDFTDMRAQISELDKAKVDYFHIDVMDGHFVPNLMLPNEIIKAIKKLSDTPLDFHFMTDNPVEAIKWYTISKGDIVSIHLEALNNYFDEIEEYIHNIGAKLFIAIKPETPVSMVKPLLNRIEGILIMTVVPGFSGGKLVPETLDKIKEARILLDKFGYEDKMIEVDGNVTYPNAEIMRSKGADMFAGGTSSIFKKDISITEGVNYLRESIKKGE